MRNRIIFVLAVAASWAIRALNAITPRRLP